MFAELSRVTASYLYPAKVVLKKRHDLTRAFVDFYSQKASAQKDHHFFWGRCDRSSKVAPEHLGVLVFSTQIRNPGDGPPRGGADYRWNCDG